LHITLNQICKNHAKIASKRLTKIFLGIFVERLPTSATLAENRGKFAEKKNLLIQGKYGSWPRPASVWSRDSPVWRIPSVLRHLHAANLLANHSWGIRLPNILLTSYIVSTCSLWAYKQFSNFYLAIKYQSLFTPTSEGQLTSMCWKSVLVRSTLRSSLVIGIVRHWLSPWPPTSSLTPPTSSEFWSTSRLRLRFFWLKKLLR